MSGSFWASGGIVAASVVELSSLFCEVPEYSAAVSLEVAAVSFELAAVSFELAAVSLEVAAASFEFELSLRSFPLVDGSPPVSGVDEVSLILGRPSSISQT